MLIETRCHSHIFVGGRFRLSVPIRAGKRVNVSQFLSVVRKAGKLTKSVWRELQGDRPNFARDLGDQSGNL